MNSFTDSKGTVWRPVITVPVVIDFCRDAGIKLKDLMDPTSLNAGDLLDLLWYSCRKQAVSMKINRDAFYDGIPLATIPEAVQVTINALIESFPAAKDFIGMADLPLASQPGNNPATETTS